MNRTVQQAVEAAMKIDGWMNEAELTWLAEQAEKCQYVVEFGAWKGRSTKALTTCGHRVWVFDWFDGFIPGKPVQISQALEFSKNLQLELQDSRVWVYPYHSFKAPLFVSFPINMVFIDACHQYEYVKQDIDVAKWMLRNGGLLCGHDFSNDYPGVQQAVREMVPDFQRVPGGDIWFKVLS